MLKVIDYNVLSGRDRLLENFFEDNSSNFGIIIDSMGIESMKRDSVRNYRNSYRIISNFSSRIAVLKSVPEIRKIFPKKEGALVSFFDRERTATIVEYCNAMLHNWHRDNERVIAQRQMVAREFMQKLEAVADSEFRNAIKLMEGIWKERRLKIQRPDDPLSQEELQIATIAVTHLAMADFKRVFPDSPLPDQEEDFLSWMPARYSVALQALTIHWLRNRGIESATPATLRNDSMDSFYVTFGSYCDGVLSADNRLQDISRISASILADGFGVKPNS